jgi:hypothetical protein
MNGQRVAIRESSFGATSVELDDALRGRGATAIEIPTCRWSLPGDTWPLAALIGARPSVEANPPKLGPLVNAPDETLSKAA